MTCRGGPAGSCTTCRTPRPGPPARRSCARSTGPAAGTRLPGAIADALDGVAPRPAPELFDGEEIDLSGPRGQAFLRARSHGPADAGAGGVRWFSDRVVRLAFRVPETNRSAARVLRLAGLRKRSRRPLTVRLNGHVIAQRRVPEACDLELDVPAGLLAADSVLEIEGDTPWRCRTGATTGAGPGPGNMPISGCAPWRC